MHLKTWKSQLGKNTGNIDLSRPIRDGQGWGKADTPSLGKKILFLF